MEIRDRDQTIKFIKESETDDDGNVFKIRLQQTEDETTDKETHRKKSESSK